MMRIFLFTLFISCLSILTLAQNPIVTPGVYIADPSAHVWADGKPLLPILKKLSEFIRCGSAFMAANR
jgi:hypothetical protein